MKSRVWMCDSCKCHPEVRRRILRDSTHGLNSSEYLRMTTLFYQRFVMPIISADQAKTEYDVVIVGSGAGGGQAAYTLTLAGFKCIMLEAGRSYDPVKETPMFNPPSEAPLMGDADGRTSRSVFTMRPSAVGGRCPASLTPISPASKRDEEFKWWRPRMLGGRTNHWGRISLRNGQYDFKPRSRDGLGFDWPINYEDLEPYYTKVEMLIGVYGTNEGLENTPSSPDGVLLPAPQRSRRGAAYPKAWQEARHPHHSHPPRGADQSRWTGRRIPAKLHPNDPTAQKIVGDAMRIAPAVLLGDALRARLLDQGELSIDHGSPAARAGDGQSRHHLQRPRPRSDDRQRRQSDRASRSSTRPPARSAASKARRIVVWRQASCETGSHPAELQEPRRRRFGQRQRTGRQIHHGHRRRGI